MVSPVLTVEVLALQPMIPRIEPGIFWLKPIRALTQPSPATEYGEGIKLVLSKKPERVKSWSSPISNCGKDEKPSPLTSASEEDIESRLFAAAGTALARRTFEFPHAARTLYHFSADT